MVKKVERNKENKLPKVSIIMPVYNGENYLSLAIESALRQTYKNIEIIVINDGSKDNTDKICKKYKDKIKYIAKENGGVSTALNEGIKNMTGDYFSWLSHDDLYYPNKVKDEVDYLIENNLLNTKTILHSDYSIINEHGNLLYDIYHNGRYINRDPVYGVLFGSLNGLSLLIPKKAFDEVGLFDEKLRCVQDYELWFNLYKKGYKFVHIPKVTVSTRVHSKQVTNTSPRMATEGNDFWIKTVSYFSSEDRKRLLGSEYDYWFIMHHFFVGGPYDKTADLCKEKFIEIENKKKNNNKKVSVIVNLNSTSSNNLRCLESLLNQTYKNVEYLIYNNGQLEDNNILNKFDKTNIKIFDSKKRKNASIWNDGIKNATGDFITFIEGNCTYEKDKIEKQELTMVCSENIMTYTSYKVKHNDWDELVDVGFYHWQVDDLSREVVNINLSTIMVDKKALDSNKVLFEENANSSEDTMFILKLLSLEYPFGIREPLVELYGEDNRTQKLIYLINYINEKNKILLDSTSLNNIVMELYNAIDKHSTAEETIKRNEVLKRYEYYLTREFKYVNKARNVQNKLLHKKGFEPYDYSLEELSHGKLVDIYKKITKQKR